MASKTEYHPDGSTTEWVSADRLAGLAADNTRLRKIIRRMTPKLRKHYTDEYIIHELIRGKQDD